MPYFDALGTALSNRTGSRLIEVFVCVKGGSCSLCGSMVFEDIGFMYMLGDIATEDINCTQELQGNQVKLIQLNNLPNFTQPCSVHLYGKSKY